MDSRPFSRKGDVGVLKDLFGGLTPKARLVLSSDLSREDVKGYFLTQGLSIRSETVCSSVDLALSVLGVPKKRLISDSVLPDLLRKIFREKHLGLFFRELNLLRRQKDFFSKCAEALRFGRRAYAHDAELAAYEERLLANEIRNPLRQELLGLTRVLEAWLEDHELWDEPLAFRQASARLLSGAPMGSASNALPETVFVLEDSARESLEQSFLESLATRVRVSQTSLDELLPRQPHYPKIRWETWHSIDDACDAISHRDLADSVVLIPEDSQLRVTLKRAFREAAIAESDGRDPLEPRMNEDLKLALLPIRLVKSQFGREHVVPWLRSELRPEGLTPDRAEECIARISEFGIRRGLASYRGIEGPSHGDKFVFNRLNEIADSFPSRTTIDEFRAAHEKLVPSRIRLRLVQVYDEWLRDLAFLGEKERFRRAPTRLWSERLEERFRSIRARVPPLKAENGVDLHRADHVALQRSYRKGYCLGLPSDWLQSVEIGDWFFAEREREVLAAEFQVYSGKKEAERRKDRLLRWMRQAEESFTFVDYRFDAKGGERESLGVLLPALKVFEIPERTAERGSFPRRLSYLQKWDLKPHPQDVRLEPPRLRADGVLRASELERYSRCPFTAMAAYRWKLEDLRDPEPDLWADTRGTLIHRALEVLMKSVDETGEFRLSAQDAIDQAWKDVPLKGLERSDKVVRFAKRRLVRALEKFMEEEKEYRSRSRTRVFELEKDFTLSLNGRQIRMRVDRIDEHADGLFLIDYKTSSKNPTGASMLKLGYRLQLPLYALAAKQSLQRPVIGAQFVVVGHKPDRSKGVFAKSRNGAGPGSLTQFRGNNASLLKEDLDEVWKAFEEHASRAIDDYLNGVFAPSPKKKDECGGCFYPDLCGKNRMKILAEEEGE